MADVKEFYAILVKVVSELAVGVDRQTLDGLFRLYELHGEYRERAGLSAEMDVFRYLGEFILDIFELQAAGKLVDAKEWGDIGSGGGYPGLPLAILKPESLFTLLEPSRKKTEYLRVAVKQLGLRNVVIAGSRVEDYLGGFDALTCKGLKLDFDVVLAPRLREGGTAYIFRDVSEETKNIELFSYMNRWNGRKRDISIITR